MLIWSPVVKPDSNFYLRNVEQLGSNYGTENLAESLGTPFSIDEEQAPVEVIASYGKYAVVVDQAVSKGRITILSDINLWQSSWNESSKDLLIRFLTNKAKKAGFKGALRVISLSSS